MTKDQPPEIIKDYNNRDYRTVWQHPRASFEDRFESGITRRLLSDAPGWFIDIGAGYGRVYPLFKRPDRNVVLVDYAVNLLEMAAESYKDEKDIYYIAANAYHMPFKPNTFSAGISIRTFHHMNDPKKFLTECSRISRDGAHILMEYANKRNLARVIKRTGKSLRKDHEAYGDLLYGTHPSYFAQVAKETGFTIQRNEGTGFFPRFVTEKTLGAVSVLSVAEHMFDTMFGDYALAPLTFADIQKNGDIQNTKGSGDFKDILQCPACTGSLEDAPKAMHCISCKKEYMKTGPIIDFRYAP